MASFKTEVLADNPSLWYRVAESEGTVAADSSGNSRNGTYGAGVTLGEASLLTNEPTNNAIKLSGTATGRITTTYAPFAVGSSISLEGWAKRTASATQDTLVGSDAAATSHVAATIEGDGGLMRFYSRFDKAPAEWAGAFPGNETIFQWVYTYNDSTKKVILYINKTSKGEKELAEPFAASNGNFQVGVRQSVFNNPFHGKMDELVVYPTILSEARIKAHYEAGIAEPAKFEGNTFPLSRRTRIYA